MKDKLYYYKAIVKKVTDGDTAFLEIDLGMNTWLKDDIRFARINAFETKLGKKTTAEMKKTGLEGKDYLIKLLEGKEVVVKTAFDKLVREKYGRLLVEIYLEQGPNVWININDEMVKLGYAVYQTY